MTYQEAIDELEIEAITLKIGEKDATALEMAVRALKSNMELKKTLHDCYQQLEDTKQQNKYLIETINIMKKELVQKQGLLKSEDLALVIRYINIHFGDFLEENYL